jgi:hypothetical protein
LTRTRSPRVAVPSTMDCVVMYIMAVNPTLKMAF